MAGIGWTDEEVRGFGMAVGGPAAAVPATPVPAIVRMVEDWNRGSPTPRRDGAKAIAVADCRNSRLVA
jgi:hypothetical protein